jgi:ribonuclease E
MGDSPRLLAINARDREELRVVLACAGEVEDLRWSRGGKISQVGDIYLGVVNKVESALDAAFIDFGANRAGFIHSGNLHSSCVPGCDPFKLASTTTRLPEKLVAVSNEDVVADQPSAQKLKIAEMLEPGQELIVQVQRDAVRGKGATLSSFISLPGRRLVLMPSLGRAALSRRIEDSDERRRLREEVLSADAFRECGMILRTAAAGASADELLSELELLLEEWKQLGQAAAKGDGPSCLRREPTPAVRAVRDILRRDLSEVVVDCPLVAKDIAAAIEELPKDCRPPLRVYEKTRPLFETLDIERAWQLLFRPKVSVASGASIVIHETEALCAIDVNSGRIQGDSLEETALEANLAAAEEIARQIRLRDLGGIVVVDFIDMRQSENRRQLDRRFSQLLRDDRARLKLGGLSSFGLFSLTRRRMGTGLPRAIERFCKGCGGSGTAAQHHAGALRALRLLRSAGTERELHLRIHPGAAVELKGLLEDLPQPGLELRLEEDSQLAPGDLVLR